MTKRVTDAKLKDLLGLLADVLYEQLSDTADEIAFDKNGKEVKTGKKVYTASPALLAQARQFLNDNDIKCDIEQFQGASKLKDELEKRRKSNLKTVGEIEDEELF
jgi:hypothetical protein